MGPAVTSATLSLCSCPTSAENYKTSLCRLMLLAFLLLSAPILLDAIHHRLHLCQSTHGQRALLHRLCTPHCSLALLPYVASLRCFYLHLHAVLFCTFSTAVTPPAGLQPYRGDQCCSTLPQLQCHLPAPLNHCEVCYFPNSLARV